MNWAHIHLMLNHVPVLGTVFGLTLLAYGLWRRNRDLQRAALATFVLAAVAAIPVYLTGGAAEDGVEHVAGMSENAIEAHEAAALLSLIAILVLGAAALGTLFLASTRWARIAMRAATAVALTTTALLAWTANLGGRIRHTELQATAGQREHGAPVTDEDGERRGLNSF